MLRHLRKLKMLAATVVVLVGLTSGIALAQVIPPTAPRSGPQPVPGAPVGPIETVADGGNVTPVNNNSDGNQAIDTKNLLQLYLDGGWLMHPIAFCSFLLMVFTLERAISLRKGRVIPGPFVKRFIAQLNEGSLDRDEALELCQRNKSPTAEVFAGAVKKWGRSSVEVEQALIDAGERVTNDLRSYLRLLNGIATICPLLGLLGTVTGMITAFNNIATAEAMGHPERLAGGISMALLTTAAGLCVAIPALIAYLFFVSRVDRLIMQIDAYGQDVVNAIAADGVPDPRHKSKAGDKKTGKKSASARGAA